MRSGVSESDGSSQVCVHLQELRDLIAIKNCMFAEEQSDCHEFFLYFISEFAGECQSVSQKQTSSIDSEWEEIGSGGRRLELTVAKMDDCIINSIFETTLRKQVSVGLRNDV